jgi:peptidyl-prolyl cis-trans isomerase C
VQGRPATDAEVDKLIDAQVQEEVLYREALAAGLDRDDTLVRNRLIEKMRFLTENVAEPPAPSDAELETYFAANAAKFVVPARVTFEHVFFSKDKRGDRVQADAAAALPGLRKRTGAIPMADLAKLGDPLPLWNRYDAMSDRDVALAFGDEFAAGLAPIEAGAWQGPLASRYGWHLVRVVDRSPERQPTLAEVRDAVQTAYLTEKRDVENRARYQALRDRYRVVIEPAAPQPAPQS